MLCVIYSKRNIPYPELVWTTDGLLHTAMEGTHLGATDYPPVDVTSINAEFEVSSEEQPLLVESIWFHCAPSCMFRDSGVVFLGDISAEHE